MSVRERVLASCLLEKIAEHREYAEKIGVSVDLHETDHFIEEHRKSTSNQKKTTINVHNKMEEII